MWLTGKRALVTGGSRGIGRGSRSNWPNRAPGSGSPTFRTRRRPGTRSGRSGAWDLTASSSGSMSAGRTEISRLIEVAREEWTGWTSWSATRRGELPTFYAPPLTLAVEQWDAALDTQARAFLLLVQQAADLLRDGGRIVAITHRRAAGSGGWQPWVAMGSAKAALESLCRSFAVALAERAGSPSTRSARASPRTVVNSLPDAAQQCPRLARRRMVSVPSAGLAGRHRERGGAALLEQAAWVTGQVIAADGGASLLTRACRWRSSAGSRPTF